MATDLFTRAEAAGVAWPLTTDRLTLRPFTPADAETVWTWWGLPETTEWTGSIHATAADLCAAWSDRRAHLIVEVDGVPVGDVCITMQDAWAQMGADRSVAEDSQAELGWNLHPDHRGRGYATEAVRAAIDLCFGRLGVHRIEAGAMADNAPSIAVMERLGLRREMYCVKECLHRTRGWVDGVGYALLAEEWTG